MTKRLATPKQMANLSSDLTKVDLDIIIVPEGKHCGTWVRPIDWTRYKSEKVIAEVALGRARTTMKEVYYRIDGEDTPPLKFTQSDEQWAHLCALVIVGKARRVHV